MKPSRSTEEHQDEGAFRRPWLGVGIFLLACGIVLERLANQHTLTGASATAACVAACSAGLLGIFQLFRRIRFPDEQSFVILGTALQFLLAPALSQLFFDAPWWTRLSFTEERAQVRDGYPHAMAVVLIFLAAYTLATSFWAQDARWLWQGSRKLEPDPAQSGHRSGTGVLLLLVALIWAGRFWLIYKGAYFHANTTQYVFESPVYSMIATFNRIVGIVALLAAFELSQPRRTVVAWWPWAYFAAELAYYAVSGGREYAITALLSVTAYFIIRGRATLKVLLPAGVVAIAMMSLIGIYRERMLSNVSATYVRAEDIKLSLTEAAQVSRQYKPGALLSFGLERLNDLDSVAAVCLWVPLPVDYLRGETYQGILGALVPRFIWLNKPAIVVPINHWFFREEYGSSPLTVFGEGYLNFGLPGVVGVGVVCSALVTVTGALLRRRLASSFFWPVYVSFLLYLLRAPVSVLGIWISGLSRIVIFLYAVDFLCARPLETILQVRRAKKAKGERTESAVAPANPGASHLAAEVEAKGDANP